MDLEELHRSVAAALRRVYKENAQNEKQLAEVRAVLERLIEVLLAKGVLAEGHKRVFDKTAELAGRPKSPKVRLRVLPDKYTMSGVDIDCASRFHLCHARCCSFSFELSKQDVEEGKVLWELEDPYLIRHETDGFCSHLDRRSLFCTIHAQRPGTCRAYDCRGDPRVWIDFEARVPAPMPDWLPLLKPEQA
jgi:Fe-S-cluster containining protein